jgi:predicted RNA-binding protein (virulence factor B family)
MLELGRVYCLTVLAIDSQGAWLQMDHGKVLLPKKEVEPGLLPQDSLDVFLYGDASGEPVVTRQRPLAEVGEFALMRVKQVNVHGAFMDWGLEKDLLVPPKEQPEPMRQGRRYLVKVRMDRKGRPIGTARIEPCLSSPDESVQEGQQVDLIVYRFTPLGAKVIINHRFSGLLYRDEIGSRLHYGDQLTGYIRHIRSDGKIDCALSLGRFEDLDSARKTIMKALVANKGFLPLHDKSSTAEIQAMLGLSKKLFKKGVGGLYKSDTIEFTDDGIMLKK